jgi:aminoglycoside/choline kinase family phosphotransferase
MHTRENALKEWLKQITKNNEFKLSPLAGDASFRSYYRLEYQGLSQIVMDAPPGKEDIQLFAKVAQILQRAGITTPEILEKNELQGFLLLTDLGNTHLLDKLNPGTVDSYYKTAMETLFKIQNAPDDTLPYFDQPFMISEMKRCSEWFFKEYLSLRLEDQENRLIEKTFSQLAQAIAKQPQVFIHRDYHSRNLMVMERGSLGILDFQDAMRGPLTYDLVSLLKDCYISWPRTKLLDWVHYFFTNSELSQGYSSEEEFLRDFEWCGLQRHLKVLGTFCRLALRDNKQEYLNDLPLTLKYVLECTEIYEELHPFYHFLQQRVFLP